MIVVTVEELDETKECMASASWTVVGTFRDDQKVAAFARASSEWNTLKGEIIMCPFFQEGSDPIHIPTNKYVVRAELHDAQGTWLRTLWENGRELPAPTKTGAEDIPVVNPSTSGSGPSGWQVLGALAVAVGVAYGTYRVTDAMIAPKNKRAAMNPRRKTTKKRRQSDTTYHGDFELTHCRDCGGVNCDVPEEPECTEGEEHDWGETESMSLGGTAFIHLDQCGRCGLGRKITHIGEQRNPDECDTVEYER